MKARLPLLLLASGGLAWIVAEGGATRAALPEPVRQTAPEGRPTSLIALPAPPDGPWAEQVDRPLFASSRRPPAAAAAAPPAAAARPEPPPPVAASGVVLRAAGAVALLRLTDERVVRASEGDEVEGWIVTLIDAEGVRVSRNGTALNLPVRARAAEGVQRH